MSDLKILFIAGNGRSGSTILHNVLGQIDGFCAVGELRYIWERGVIKNRLCGCGVPFRECEFWSEVMDRAFGGLENVDAEAMHDITESFRIRDLFLTSIPAVRRREEERLRGFIRTLDDLYDAIREVSGCRVVVDSSKNASYGNLLRYLEGADVHYLHFIRDSPAVAYSWGRKKEFEPGVYMPRKSSVKSALQWDARNLSAELFLARGTDRQMSLRYEEFIAEPRDTVASIVRWIDEWPADLPFRSSHEVELSRSSHSVFGNEVRFQSCPVVLRSDERWRREMSRRDQVVVKSLTLPLRLRYGYAREGVGGRSWREGPR